MSDYVQLSDLKHRFCYTKRHHRFSAFPTRLAVTPGICSSPKFNCYGQIPENKTSLSIHVKPMYTEQTGSGIEQKKLATSKEKNNSTLSAKNESVDENRDLKTILYKMAHPVFHVKEESLDSASNASEQSSPINHSKIEEHLVDSNKKPVYNFDEDFKRKKQTKYKRVKRSKIDFDNLDDNKPFLF